MEKTLPLLFSCLAVLAALTGCRGGRQSRQADNQTQQQTAQTNPEESFTPVEIPANCQGVAFRAYEADCAAQGTPVKGTCPEDCTLTYTYTFNEEEGYEEVTTYTCFPLREDGYLVLSAFIGAAESSPGYYHHETFTFQDDKLTKVTGMLPLPEEVDGFLSKEACEGKDAEVEQLRALYRSRPSDFVVYYADAGKQTLSLELRPRDLEEEEGVWSSAFWDLRSDDMIVYRWNGEKFVL